MNEADEAVKMLEECARQLKNMGGMLNLEIAKAAAKCASRLRDALQKLPDKALSESTSPNLPAPDA